MKKTFEYDLTKYSPDAPTRTEEFLTADGVKTLTTDANDGAVLLQDEVDGDSLNPVTGAAVAAAIEAGGGGGGTEYSAGDGISIAEDTISAKVDGTTIGVNASGELEALGGGGSSLEAGQGISIQNDKINVRVDVDSIQIKSDTVISTVNDYTYDYRNIDLWSMTSGTKCDWAFGDDTGAYEITATAAQAGCQIRAALYDGNGVRISVSSKYFTNWGMPKTLVEGTNSFNGGWQWTSMVRPSGATFATEFPLPEGRSYEEVATIALVAYDSANSQVVGDPLPFTHNSDIQFKMETDANSKLSVKNPLPDSSGASQGDVLKIGSSGPEWGSAGGSDLEIVKSATYATPDGKQLRFNSSGDIGMSSNYGNTPIVSWSNGGSIGVLYSLWNFTNGSTNILSLYTGSYVNEDYHLAWYPKSNGTVYARYKSFVRNTVTDYYIYDDNGRRNVGTGYRYDIEVPPGPNTEFDTSKFDLVGDWSTVVRPVEVWGLGFVDTEGNMVPAGLTYGNRTTTWSVSGRRPTVNLKTNGGISRDPWKGLYVTVPVPAFDASTDAGKVLQVQNDGTLAWVTLS